MKATVRDLYKRFLVVGKDYPKGLGYVREKAKKAFIANRNLQKDEEINRAVAKGRYMVKELIGVIQLKKYRSIKKRYGVGSEAETETQ